MDNSRLSSSFDTEGPTVIGQAVALDSPLGPAPPR